MKLLKKKLNFLTQQWVGTYFIHNKMADFLNIYQQLKIIDNNLAVSGGKQAILLIKLIKKKTAEQ